jgi:putative sigma-54 modulation protein
MRISVKGRDVPISPELQQRVERRFEKVAKQVSELAELDVELREERSATGDPCVAEATLRLKGVSLRACDRSPDWNRSLNLVADELARQVKRHRDKRRRRREARASSATPAGPA